MKAIPSDSPALSEIVATNRGSIASSLLPAGYRPVPLAAYRTSPEFFTFPSISMPTASPHIDQLPTASSVRPTDLVIPSECGHASSFASIEGLGRVHKYDGPAGKPVYIMDDRADFPVLTVGAFVG